jgi:hypothetical protein
MKKKHLLVQKRPSKEEHFFFSNFSYFLSPEVLSNTPKVHISQNKRKKIDRKSTKKKYLFENLKKKVYFWGRLFGLFNIWSYS